jgi:hypothetical protein
MSRVWPGAVLIVFVALVGTATAQAPDTSGWPAGYADVPRTLSRSGDFKVGVLKINVPRSDLAVTIHGRPVPTSLGFGGWVAFTEGDGGTVMMGDLVLTEDEVTPVASAHFDNGIEFTAIHNHFFWELPRIFYVHVHGHGAVADLARAVAPALGRIGRGAPAAAAAPPASGAALDTDRIAQVLGTRGESNGPVYKVTIGRPDVDLRDHGARINARMGLNTWAAFAGTDEDAIVAGDVAMLATEVQPVLRALRSGGIDVVALHHHMVGTTPAIYFVHYQGVGRAAALAATLHDVFAHLGHGQEATRSH